MKLPKGFLASGVRAGIRKKRPDLGMILAPDGASAAAVFTKNRFQAAPVVLSKAALKKSGGMAAALHTNPRRRRSSERVLLLQKRLQRDAVLLRELLN